VPRAAALPRRAGPLRAAVPLRRSAMRSNVEFRLSPRRCASIPVGRTRSAPARVAANRWDTRSDPRCQAAIAEALRGLSAQEGSAAASPLKQIVKAVAEPACPPQLQREGLFLLTVCVLRKHVALAPTDLHEMAEHLLALAEISVPTTQAASALRALGSLLYGSCATLRPFVAAIAGKLLLLRDSDAAAAGAGGDAAIEQRRLIVSCIVNLCMGGGSVAELRPALPALFGALLAECQAALHGLRSASLGADKYVTAIVTGLATVVGEGKDVHTEDAAELLSLLRLALQWEERPDHTGALAAGRRDASSHSIAAHHITSSDNEFASDGSTRSRRKAAPKKGAHDVRIAALRAVAKVASASPKVFHKYGLAHARATRTSQSVYA
jgi:hypothetical protein